MKPCCEKEIKRSIKKHRDVAVCDGCQNLILAYGNDTDFQKTVQGLEKSKITFETTTANLLKIVIKAPPPA